MRLLRAPFWLEPSRRSAASPSAPPPRPTQGRSRRRRPCRRQSTGAALGRSERRPAHRHYCHRRHRHHCRHRRRRRSTRSPRRRRPRPAALARLRTSLPPRKRVEAPPQREQHLWRLTSPSALPPRRMRGQSARHHCRWTPLRPSSTPAPLSTRLPTRLSCLVRLCWSDETTSSRERRHWLPARLSSPLFRSTRVQWPRHRWCNYRPWRKNSFRCS
mmetsp:Transcript_52429/g.157299  ORF Transcript_52429/g.157299 Transcript_52429/m.157299 type:complete len:216 (-) Transcript_52429:183-830(-)